MEMLRALDSNEILEYIWKNGYQFSAEEINRMMHRKQEIGLEKLYQSEKTMAAESERDPAAVTGFKELDDLLSGLYPGELIVVGSCPGMGKT